MLGRIIGPSGPAPKEMRTEVVKFADVAGG